MKQRNLIDDAPYPNTYSTILWAGLIAGVLDGVAAALFFHAKSGLNAGQVMQFVASALYGPDAFKEGFFTIFIGTILHFLIAFIISAIYFYAYPSIKLLRSWPVQAGLFYGLGVWLVINLLVLPMTRLQLPPFDVQGAIIAISWHMLLIGLPIALMTSVHYRSLSPRRSPGFSRINRFRSKY